MEEQCGQTVHKEKRRGRDLKSVEPCLRKEENSLDFLCCQF